MVELRFPVVTPLAATITELRNQRACNRHSRHHARNPHNGIGRNNWHI